MKKLLPLLTILALIMTGIIAQAAETNYPTRPVEIIVPFGPGGDTDFNARILAKYLEKELGKAFIITNMAGGGGTIGAEEVMRSKPDGYRLLVMHVQIFTNKAFGTVDWGYDAMDIVSAYGQGTGEIVMVRSDFPANNLQEMMEYLKKNPGKNFGCTPGGGSHYTGVVLNSEGVDLNIVTIGDTGERLIGLKNGTLEVIQSALPPARDYIEKGEFKIIGVTLSKRYPSYPDVPTLKEQGIDISLDPTYTLYAPKGTPPEVLAKLDAAIKNVVENNKEYAAEIMKAYKQVPFYMSGKDVNPLFEEFDKKFMSYSKLLRESY